MLLESELSKRSPLSLMDGTPGTLGYSQKERWPTSSALSSCLEYSPPPFRTCWWLSSRKTPADTGQSGCSVPCSGYGRRRGSMSAGPNGSAEPALSTCLGQVQTREPLTLSGGKPSETQLRAQATTTQSLFSLIWLSATSTSSTYSWPSRPKASTYPWTC